MTYACSTQLSVQLGDDRSAELEADADRATLPRWGAAPARFRRPYRRTARLGAKHDRDAGSVSVPVPGRCWLATLDQGTEALALRHRILEELAAGPPSPLALLEVPAQPSIELQVEDHALNTALLGELMSHLARHAPEITALEVRHDAEGVPELWAATGDADLSWHRLPLLGRWF